MDRWAPSSDEEASPMEKKAEPRARQETGDDARDGLPAKGGRGCAHRDLLKAGVSLVTAALFFPFLVWGGFVFLPFDAPVLRGAPLRMLYATRCSVFAAVPIVSGWLAVGVARLRLRPPPGGTEDDGGEEPNFHRRYAGESASLFLMYFSQLAVTAVYLRQEQLKLVPLLALVFALGRFGYWAAGAWGSSVRVFGMGLSFLPTLTLAAANLALAAQSPSPEAPNFFG
ncbi:transmembrane protein 79-like isoform X2 [Stigmatopora argus]